MTNKNEQRKVPELRFPEFSGEWEESKFYNVVKIDNKMVNPQLEKYKDYPHIGPGNIEKQSGRILEYKLVGDENLISGKFEFNERDIIYGKINPQLAKIALPKFKGLCSADAYPISVDNDVANTEFVYYSMFTKRFFKYSVSVSMRTGIPKINREELGMFSFYLPILSEQQKIGEFFSKLDRQIELEEKKLALLEEQKKGYMQKIFSQELRFKDENGEEYPEWKTISLRDCSEYKNSNITIKSLSNEMFENLFPVYDANNIVGWSSDFQFNESYISIIKDGAGVGRIRLLPAYSSILGTMGGIIPNHEMIHLGFLYLLLEQINFGIFTTGSTIPHIYYSDYSRVQVPLPSKEEQLKISTFLNNIEQQRKYLTNKRKNLAIQKQELLTKIFV
ncbi:restriction endonuclease subunit S [Macrococcus psychrotolerans]